MIDVVLYGYDRRGLLTLRERSFSNQQALVRYFGSMEALAWTWAEVSTIDEEGRSKIVRYSAEQLRTSFMQRRLAPLPN